MFLEMPGVKPAEVLTHFKERDWLSCSVEQFRKKCSREVDYTANIKLIHSILEVHAVTHIN